jgi:hypothetical protein
MLCAASAGCRPGKDHELDVSAALDVGDRYVLLLKYAHFEAVDPAFNDTEKLWLMLTASY